MVVASTAKNEVDEQLERLHEEERTHYKVGPRSSSFPEPVWPGVCPIVFV